MPVRGVTAGKAVMTATATERRAATVRASGRHTSSEAKVVALTVPVTAGTVTTLGLIRPTAVRRDRPAKGQRGANPTIPISMSTTGRLAGTVTTPPAIRRGASAGAADTADRKAVSREAAVTGTTVRRRGVRSVMPRGTVTAKARNRESMPAVGRMAAARAANGVMATASVLTANAVRGTGKGTAANLTELRAAVLTAVDRPTGVVRRSAGPQSAQVQFGELSDFSGAGYRG